MAEPSFLLIDTNPFVLRGLVDILAYLNFRNVRTTTSTVDAWSMVRFWPVDCVICAWDMPDMTGPALLRILRTDDNLSEVSFFLSRNEFSPVHVVEAGKSGVTGLIVKPYNVDTVRKKVQSFMEIHTEPAIVEARKSLREGLDRIETGDYSAALSIFEKMTAEGESAEVYYNIGYIKASQKKFDEALIAFHKATQLDRLFAKAYEAMGRVYRELGQFDEAEKHLQKAADLYIGKAEDEYAEQVLHEILEISPDTINVYNSLGVICRKKGDYLGALKHYRKALRVHPNEANIHYNIGRLHIDMKLPEEAARHFRKALDLDPTFKDARDVLRAIELGAF